MLKSLGTGDPKESRLGIRVLQNSRNTTIKPQIRRRLFNFIPDKSLTESTPIIVDTVCWLPHQVEVQTTRSSVYLGGIQTLNNSGKETLKWLLRKEPQLCKTVRYSRFFMILKVMVTTTSIVTRLKYDTVQDVLA